ncbi:MAG: 30S ribosomal protein S16 [Candidatus Ryanbacteria bacterium]|nr:30S ribosomal protein S16 [Candidatus Ryanbacteria bacterium]
MLKIRLMRIGKRGQAYFRVVVQEQRSKNKGKYLEDLGSWNPHKNDIQLKEEKVKHWLANGAKPSDTVHNFLVDKGLIEGPKVKKVRPKKKEQEQKPTEAAPTVPAEPSQPTENQQPSA